VPASSVAPLSAFRFPVPAKSFICKSSVWQTLCEKLTLAQNTKVRGTRKQGAEILKYRQHARACI